MELYRQNKELYMPARELKQVAELLAEKDLPYKAYRMIMYLLREQPFYFAIYKMVRPEGICDQFPKLREFVEEIFMSGMVI